MLILAVLVLFGGTVNGRGATHAMQLGGCRVTVYAPDWIWQGQAVNIIAVAENPGGPSADLSIRVTPPASGATAGIGSALAVSTNVPAGQQVRMLVGRVTPAANAPKGTYAFRIEAAAGAASDSFDYPLTVIRGSLVEAGLWSVLLPALIALLWSGVLLAVLPRFSRPGAWKTPSPPFAEQADEEWFRS